MECIDKGFKGVDLIILVECWVSIGFCDFVENCIGSVLGCLICNVLDVNCCIVNDLGCINGFWKDMKTCYVGIIIGIDGDGDEVVDD